ncbi:hypothetical protein [Aliidiomarina haloalkalitolerans]|uniref:Uncharacterized protein n=1 Tax=Aliidiomarina haloalkalitolerans TaxID=859059 RepID=A0A432VZ23_9GAMM|nr:hypothetical protein [Aliidiomarina haloalkalitolerans]MCL4410093.1 hypothetical protein [Gammaproteobacteria bacterium]RUO21898.1 hypothetical protein CWE06_03375 [Aliidiomarina haloalkalitolerans]
MPTDKDREPFIPQPVSKEKTIQKTIALVTAPIGLIFLLSDAQDLLRLIQSTGLNWYQVFSPIAWGIIIGAILGLMRFDKVQVAAKISTWLATALTTFGLVGSIAIYFEHRLWYLAWPTLWLAALGIGIYALFLMQLRFSEKYQQGQ